MTINPKDATPDQPHLVTHAGEEYVGIRNDPDSVFPWTLLKFDDFDVNFRSDKDIDNLVPLAPACPVTRDDLPSASSAWRSASKSGGIIPTEFFVSEVLDAVVAHLNANSGIPAEKPRKSDYVLNNGKCCEEAQFTANEAKAARDNWQAASRRAHRAESELARRDEELSEAEGEVAALTIRAERAEAELGEWKQTAANALRERDCSWRAEARLKAERDELQAKLDAAENRPTLDRGAVESALHPYFDEDEDYELYEGAIKAIMALAPAAEGWPERLGPKVDPDDYEVRTGDIGEYLIGIGSWKCQGSEDAREEARKHIIRAAKWEAVARFIESEQAATGDEDQRVEELFELVTDLIDLEPLDPDLAGSIHDGCRAAVNAKWTPPESEATE